MACATYNFREWLKKMFKAKNGLVLKKQLKFYFYLIKSTFIRNLFAVFCGFLYPEMPCPLILYDFVFLIVFFCFELLVML